MDAVMQQRSDEYAALVDARGCCVTPPDSALFVPDVVIKRSAIHGFGGFAGRAFRAGETVLEYRGRMMSKTEGAEVCEKHDFVFIVDDEFDLDGLVPGNQARFVNHSCDPNCAYEVRGQRVFLKALRDIRVGEELTFNYEWESDDPIKCYCRARVCCGTMNPWILSADERARLERERGIRWRRTHKRGMKT